MKQLDLYVIKDGKKLRCGYTTGSCATAASKASTVGIVTGTIPDFIEIDTPAGIVLNLKVENKEITDDYASCSITKDSGDDPDSTDEIEIFSKVSLREDDKIVIKGGKGVGTITRDGFWGKSGEAAINPVPRKTIEKEVRTVTDRGLDVEIYVPKGKEIAKKTYNSNIGITGGISIIGTKGIVEPMSEEAFKKSIYIEIDSIKDRGKTDIVLYLGNHGEKIYNEMQNDADGVKISNFIGDSISYCYNNGFKSVVLVGHIGKLCKLSLGAFNTHSKICDLRIESFVYYLAMRQAPISVIEEVNQCITSEEALSVIINSGYRCIIKDMIKGCESRIKRYVKDENFDIKVVMYSMDLGIL